jgi:NAD(P)H-nitrite reductase large subunit
MNIKLGLMVAAMLGSFGCATTGAERGQPGVAGVDSDGIPTVWAPGAVTGAAACHATSQAKVLARRVLVSKGVQATTPIACAIN